MWSVEKNEKKINLLKVSLLLTLSWEKLQIYSKVLWRIENIEQTEEEFLHFVKNK